MLVTVNSVTANLGKELFLSLFLVPSRHSSAAPFRSSVTIFFHSSSLSCMHMQILLFSPNSSLLYSYTNGFTVKLNLSEVRCYSSCSFFWAPFQKKPLKKSWLKSEHFSLRRDIGKGFRRQSKPKSNWDFMEPCCLRTL